MSHVTRLMEEKNALAREVINLSAENKDLIKDLRAQWEQLEIKNKEIERLEGELRNVANPMPKELNDDKQI